MDKHAKARLILLQIEAIQGCEQGQPMEHYLTLVNEVFRDAKALAQATLEEEPSKAA